MSPSPHTPPAPADACGHCSCTPSAPPPAPAAGQGAESTAPGAGHGTVFRIASMDCAAEESEIRHALAGVSGLRGLHFQRPPFTQAKLVRCVRGKVLDVAVDIRKGSPTYGQHVAVELTEDNHRQFFIPRGFAHGFSVLSDEVIFQYKCDNFYAPQSEGAIAWNDPALKIDWRIPTEKVILSEKDKHHPLLADAEWLFDYHEDLYKE